MNDSLLIQCFSAVLDVPQPPETPFIHQCLNGCIEIRWKEPIHRDSVPETLYYELEGINPSDGSIIPLVSNYCSLSIPICYL